MVQGKSFIQPVKNALLVQILKKEEQKTRDGIIIPDTTPSDIVRGRIILIGHEIASSSMARTAGLVPGSIVLFVESAKENVSVGSDQVIIPEGSILAVEMSESSPEALEPNDFFRLPEWKEFIGVDHSSWEEFSNIHTFSIKVSYQEPFREMGQVVPAVYGQLFSSLAGVKNLERNFLRYEKEKQNHHFKIIDDTWDALYSIFEDENVFIFSKASTGIENLHQTLPLLLTAYQRMMQVPQFRAILGAKYAQVTNVVIRFHQQIHLEGKGTSKIPIRNSDLMQQFLKLLSSKDDSSPATLETLGFAKEDLGRVDLKISFNKAIGDHRYRVFANIEAPSNDGYRLIDVKWEIQDLTPGDLDERNYGPVFTDFFKNVVIRAFYHRWFKDPQDIICTTLKA